MDWSDVGKNIVKFGAPLLGGVIAGQPGAALGTLIAAQFNADPNSPDDIIAKMNVDPDTTIKLKQIESDERIQLQEIARDNFELEVRDTESARNREVEKAKTGEKDNTPKNLAYMITFGFLSVVFITAFFPIQKDAMPILEIMIGFLGGGAATVWGYYFGSSSSSRHKDDLMAIKK